jgi:glycosyltransferase involved in cell wall biosynthesis
MRVLVTHERFLPDFCGGCEYAVYQMARHLQRRGVELRVLTTGNPAHSEYDGIPTRRLPIHRYRMNLAVEEVTDCARGVDVIQTSNYHACLSSLIAGRSLRKPVVLLVTALFQEAWTETRGLLLGSAYAGWERFLMRLPFSRIVFPSEYSRQLGVRIGVCPRRSVVNSPGVDLEKYGPAPQKDDAVLFVGKFDRRKGIFDILAAAQALPHIPFRLVGWGPEAEAVRKAAPANVELIELPAGAVTRECDAEKLRKAFADAPIFFLPSKAETLGLVVIEAMASGCAVVSTVPLEYQGASVAAGDVSGMVEAIRALSADRPKTAEMGRRNMELAKFYNWDRFTDSLLDLYTQVLEENHD